MLVDFTMATSGPLSVVLPKLLRERLMREARSRGLPLSTAVRMLAAERVREIDEALELSAADQWQRAQAWTAWQQLRAGALEESAPVELTHDFDGALARREAKARGGRRR